MKRDLDQHEITKRIETLIATEMCSKAMYAKKVGIDPGNFNKKLAGEQKWTINDVFKICTKANISKEWLLDGIGEMMAKEVGTPDLLRDANAQKNEVQMSKIPGMLPEVSFAFAAGQTNLINWNESTNRYWYLPDCTDCDAVVPIEGNSMSPNIPPGSFAVLKRFNVTANNPNSIPFGQVFGVVVEDESTGEYHGYIKVLRRYSDPEKASRYWIAHSFNPDYDDFDIHLSQVRSLWIVKQHIVSNMAY